MQDSNGLNYSILLIQIIIAIIKHSVSFADTLGKKLVISYLTLKSLCWKGGKINKQIRSSPKYMIVI